jgi:hypothetical protein
MLSSEKLFLWDKGIQFSPKTSGVYLFYDKNRQIIYIGGTENIRKTFMDYFESNFSSDPRKKETKYYKRMTSSTWKQTHEVLLKDYYKKFGKTPKYNNPVSTHETKKQDNAFHFYTEIDKPLFITATDLEDFWKKIRILPISSITFHYKRGDFTRWIQEIWNDQKLIERMKKIQSDGEQLRIDLLDLSNPDSLVITSSKCPKCETLNTPIKTWKMAGRPNRKGEKLELTIGYHKCKNCNKSFRKVLKKVLI